MKNTFEQLQNDIDSANKKILKHVNKSDDMIQQRCELMELATECIREAIDNGIVTVSHPSWTLPMFIFSEYGAEMMADKMAVS